MPRITFLCHASAIRNKSAEGCGPVRTEYGEDMNTAHYFDYAAATPLRQELVELYPEYCRLYSANPHGTSVFNNLSRRAIVESGEALLDFLDIPPAEAEVIWCSCATEALNLAILGWQPPTAKFSLVLDPTAHPAMLEPSLHRTACSPEARLVKLTADKGGLLPQIPAGLQDAKAAMLCLCHLNNETGILAPTVALSQAMRAVCPATCLCLDASQCLGRVALPWTSAQVTLLALSLRKAGGPQLGVLIRRRNCRLSPLWYGGGQQDGLRPGTLDAPSIALVKPLLTLLKQEQADNFRKLSALNTALCQELSVVGQGRWEILTPPTAPPSILSVRLPGYDAGVFVRLLAQAHGFQISSGSACAAESPAPSHVLTAMGYPPDFARQVIRLCLSPAHTLEDIRNLVQAIRKTIEDY